jgi:hypothetical protein
MKLCGAFFCMRSNLLGGRRVPTAHSLKQSGKRKFILDVMYALNLIPVMPNRLKYLLFLLFPVLASVSLKAQPNFQKTYAFPSSSILQDGWSIVSTGDGGYAIGGFISGTGAGVWDLLLLRINSMGDTLWSKLYGGPNYEGQSTGGEPIRLRQTSDAGFILVGSTMSFGAGGFDVYVVKTDSVGTVEWSRTYGTPGIDYGHDICELANGYVIASYHTPATGYGNAGVIRINSNGDTLWTKKFGGPFIDMSYAVKETPYGELIIAGRCNPSSSASYDYMLLKMDANGSVIWQKAYGPSASGQCRFIELTADGGYIFGGNKQITGFSQEIYIIKTDSAGNIAWSKRYGSASIDDAYDIKQTSDGGYIISGGSGSFVSSSNMLNAILIRTNSVGDTIWTRSYGGGNQDIAKSVLPTSDGGFIFSGHSGNYLYLVKTDSLGYSGCFEQATTISVSVPTISVATYGSSSSGLSVSLPKTTTTNGYLPETILCMDIPPTSSFTVEETTVNVAPNPLTNTASIRFSNRANLKLSFELIDATGRKVYYLEGITGSQFDFNRGGLKNGFYYFRLFSEQGNAASGKLILK